MNLTHLLPFQTGNLLLEFFSNTKYIVCATSVRIGSQVFALNVVPLRED